MVFRVTSASFIVVGLWALSSLSFSKFSEKSNHKHIYSSFTPENTAGRMQYNFQVYTQQKPTI